MGITSTFDPMLRIGMSMSISNTIISYPINSYHPYERVGNLVRSEIYDRCEYKIVFGKGETQKIRSERDRIHVYKKTSRKAWEHYLPQIIAAKGQLEL